MRVRVHRFLIWNSCNKTKNQINNQTNENQHCIINQSNSNSIRCLSLCNDYEVSLCKYHVKNVLSSQWGSKLFKKCKIYLYMIYIYIYIFLYSESVDIKSRLWMNKWMNKWMNVKINRKLVVWLEADAHRCFSM